MKFMIGTALVFVAIAVFAAAWQWVLAAGLLVLLFKGLR